GVTRARCRCRTKPDRAIGFPGLTTRLSYRACPPGRPPVVDLIVVDWGRVAAGHYRIGRGPLGEIGHEPVDVPVQHLVGDDIGIPVTRLWRTQIDHGGVEAALIYQQRRARTVAHQVS